MNNNRPPIFIEDECRMPKGYHKFRVTASKQFKEIETVGKTWREALSNAGIQVKQFGGVYGRPKRKR